MCLDYNLGPQLRLRGEVHRVVAARDQKYQSNFVEVGNSPHCSCRLFHHVGLPQFRNYKIVYRRYAGLFFCVCVDANDNELAYLEAIHLFVEILGAFGGYRGLPGWLMQKTDAFFDNVCELDLVFNFYKVRCNFLTIRANANPVTHIRFMPFWTKCFWQERLKKRAKTWYCPD